MDCCADSQTITIYKGFATHWNGSPLINVGFNTEIDLTGFSAIFRIGETEKTYTDIAEGFSIDLTKEETGALPVGLNYGELIVVDNETHKRPFTTALPFNVLTFVEGDIHLDNYNVNVTTKISGVDLTIKIETPKATIDPEEIERYISEHNLDEESHPYILGELDKKVDKVSTANRVYGTDENGDQTTYDANSFGQVDDVQVGGVSVVQNKIASLGTMAGESVSNYRTSSDQDIIDTGLSDRIDDIEEVIPEQATAQNQLADKSFVNSSISTNTANFIGTFYSVEDLENYSGTLTNNDYAFVVGLDSEGNTVYNRYKYTDATTPASWIFEYALNNSSFTANQWAAINSGATNENIAQIATNTTAIQTINNSAVMNSGITSSKVSQYDGYATSKQNTINDLETIRAGASAGSTAVQPSAIANMQTTDNMVQTVRASASAETTKYPSEKAVALKSEALQNAIDQETTNRLNADDYLDGRIDRSYDIAENALNLSVKTTDTIPITDYTLLNVPVQYKGATNQNYTNGYFYKFTDPVYSSTVTVQTGSFTVAVDNAKFISWVLKADRYFFRKQDSYNWYNYEMGEVSDYLLNYYGITISGTVNVGDRFYVDISMDTTVTRIDVQPAGGSVASVNGQTGTVVLDATDVGALPDTTVIPTDTADLTNGAGFITLSALSGYATQTWVGQQGYLTSTALSGYATEQWVGQQGYLTGITSSMVTTALGYTPYNITNPSGYQANVIETVKVNGTALTPSSKAVDITVPTNNNQLTNGAGYITSSALSGYQTTANLVTSVSSSSTDTQYPSAKLFYDTCGDIETLINAL